MRTKDEFIEQKRQEALSGRNKLIYDRFKKGESASKLAQEYNITRARLYQIVKYVETGGYSC